VTDSKVRKPRNAVLYCRISDARNGEDNGVRDQEADLRNRAAQLGWGIGRVIVENDYVNGSVGRSTASAFKRRKVKLPDGRTAMRVVRPGWREMLDDLADGRADALLALDLDRAARDPRDLEDLIDVIESRTPRIPVESVTGSLKLANDADITMARVMVAVGNKSSRDTARRVARARLRQASNGEYGGGRRPYGFEPDGVSIRMSEAAEIVKAADGILAGMTLRATVAEMNRRGVRTVSGRPWTSVTVKGLLTSPRIAGLVIYKGEVLEEASASWPAILPRETWDALRHILTDPNRRTSPGSTPRWLGSHLYRCGHPDHLEANPPVTMRAGTAGGGAGRPRVRAYRCRESAHLVRAAAGLDDYVEKAIIERLSRPDAADLLAPRVDVDTTALHAEANAIRGRITEAKDAWESGVFTLAELKVRTSRLRERLTEVEGKLNAASGRDPLVGLAGNPDAAKVWKALDLGRKRAALDAVMRVTVMPAKRGRYFDHNSVRIDWNRK
jgi:site-specific DNA recombinase